MANSLERFATQLGDIGELQNVWDTIEIVLSKISGNWRLDQTTDKYKLYSLEQWEIEEEKANMAENS